VFLTSKEDLRGELVIGTPPTRLTSPVLDNLLYTIMLASPTWGAFTATVYMFVMSRLSGLSLSRAIEK
jgi:hypothetical protein